MKRRNSFISVLSCKPCATALIKGSRSFSEICGHVRFYKIRNGVIVAAEISGLPQKCEKGKGSFLGFHIHEGARCCGDQNDAFADVGPHFALSGGPHPYHSGDMPPLLVSGGTAFSVFLTDRFSVKDIIGRSVIIHSMPDDFKTQPSGDSGIKIACGEIRGC